MHPIVKLFLQVYVQWLSMGHPETRVLSNSHGLCVNLSRFCFHINVCHRERINAVKNLRLLFHCDHMSLEYPFNPGGKFEYHTESNLNQMNANTKRTEWAISKVPHFKPVAKMPEFIVWLNGLSDTPFSTWEEILDRCRPSNKTLSQKIKTAYWWITTNDHFK